MNCLGMIISFHSGKQEKSFSIQGKTAWKKSHTCYLSCMKQFLSMVLFSFIFGKCVSTPPNPALPMSQISITIQGKLQSIPEPFQAPYNWEIRFYNCPETDFGKKKADTGHYPRKPNDCRNSYSQEFFQTNSPNYKFSVMTPEKWTHGFIQIKTTKEIIGKYSPGENPFWFSPEDLKNNTLEKNFAFTSTENPIPDAEQFKLAQKFSPIIILKKDKKYLPTNLAKYSKSYTIQAYNGKNKDSSVYDLEDSISDEYMILEEELHGKGETHLYFHVRYAETFVSGTNPKSLPGWRDNRNYRYDKGKGDIVISYYLWYDYNDGPSPFGNRHQGDFESYAILADKNGKPKRFMVTGHDHIMLDTSWKNINSLENHPIIYIAHGRGNADGGNPTSPYGGYETSLEAGNALFNWIADPKDIFPDIEKDSQIILPQGLDPIELKNLRIGPGEWISQEKTKYIDASSFVTRKIERLVKWEEPAWVNQKADKDPDKNHDVKEEDSFFMNFRGRIGAHPRGSLNFLKFAQYGRSPVNPPFKMNIEQHFTWQNPSEDRCEKARVGDYCEKFQGDERTPQFKSK
jgi:hypothetical protein